MTKKIKVSVSITGRFSIWGEAEMTREQYEAYCERIDQPSYRSDRERIADELVEFFRLDFINGNIDDLEVDDFIESKEPVYADQQ